MQDIGGASSPNDIYSIRVILQPGAYDFHQPKHKETKPKSPETWVIKYTCPIVYRFLNGFKICYSACNSYRLLYTIKILSINIYCLQRLIHELKSYCMADNNLV